MSGGILQQDAASLVQLIAASVTNSSTNHFPQPRSYVYDEKSLTYNSARNEYKMTVQRRADTYVPKTIIIKKRQPSVTINQLNTLHITVYDRYTLYSIPVALLCACGNVVDTPTYITITFNFSMFLAARFINAGVSQEINYTITMRDNTNIDGIDMVTQFIYLDRGERHQVIESTERKPIQQILSTIIVCEQPQTDISVDLRVGGMSKGYIIEGNVDSITRFSVKIHNNELYSYTVPMLNTIGKRLSDRLWYIPFNADADLFDTSIESYQGGLYHSRVESVVCSISCSTPQTEFTIHSVTHNMLFTQMGSYTLRFDYGQSVNRVRNMSAEAVAIEAGLARSLTAPAVTEVSLIEVWASGGNRLINPDRNTCAILQDTIQSDTKYATCTSCRNNFDFITLTQYFDTSRSQYRSETCPMCRTNWTSCTYYINSDAPNAAIMPAVNAAVMTAIPQHTTVEEE